MRAIVVPQRSFESAFKQAEYDINKAVYDADRVGYINPADRLAATLANVQQALARLKDRLIETQP